MKNMDFDQDENLTVEVGKVVIKCPQIAPEDFFGE